MRHATSLALAALLTLTGLAARADMHVPDMSAKQAARLRVRIADTLTKRGVGTFKPGDIALDGSRRFVQGPKAGKQTRTNHLGFFAVTSQGKPEARSHVGPIPFPHEVTPATAIAGTITVRVGTPKRAWSGTHQDRPDYTITAGKIVTEAAPAKITLH